MRAIIDAFGGDNAPLAVLEGSALAVKEYGVSVLLCGDETAIRQCAADNHMALDGIEILPAARVIPVEEDPVKILKEYKDCSMAVGMQALAEGKGDAFITAGSTGAAVVGGTFIVKRMKGVKRPAIASIIPVLAAKGGADKYLLIDMGANHDCRPEMLIQFAIMGAAYMRCVGGVTDPRVGLVNIGAEETKGTELQVEAYKLLSNAPVHFVGNVEARGVPLGECDVAVADGFTGNIILKLTEGLALSFAKEIKTIFTQSVATKLAAVLVNSGIKRFKAKMDYTEHGGAPLLGLSHPVIKAHGSSNANAIKNAVRQAKLMHENNVIAATEAAMASLKNQDAVAE